MAVQQAERCPSLEIGNDVLSQLIQAGLSGTEWTLTFAVIQQLGCRGGNAVSISLREFRNLVGMDRESIRLSEESGHSRLQPAWSLIGIKGVSWICDQIPHRPFSPGP